MTAVQPPCRVRLTDDAVADLARLARHDPEIVRTIFKKMLLLERSPETGEPLLGALVGFRKLVAGNRDWRIVWRVTEDDQHDPVLDIAEVWAAGARADDQVYRELTARVERAGANPSPRVRALAAVIAEMGRLYSNVTAADEPARGREFPEWLANGLAEVLHLTDREIAGLSVEEGQRRLTEHWSRPR